MSTRHWLMVCATALLWGMVFGWAARIVTTRDNYLVAMTEAFLAERDYNLKQAQAIITDGLAVTRTKEKKQWQK